MPITPLPRHTIETVISHALAEDLGPSGDLTSLICVEEDAQLSVQAVARQSGVVCGLQALMATFAAIDPSLAITLLAADGDPIARGEAVVHVDGSARSVLSAERVALNFLGRMSGIATLTARYVEAVQGSGAVIAATRKTTPGLRAFEKQAVAAGGGTAHRFALSDAILIKDNHVAAAGGVVNALRAAQTQAHHMARISIEVDTVDQLAQVLPEKPDVILLDNFSLDDLRQAVQMRGDDNVVLEASGGVTLQTVVDIAHTGIDVISVGALTHSAPNFDFGLDAA